MILIKKLNTRKEKNGHLKRWGLFLCPYCKKEVERRINQHKKLYSCGCIRNILISKKNTKHGDCKNNNKNNRTRLCRIWGNIRQRCNNKNHRNYKDYGGRGIKICKEWNNYIPFKIWALSHGYRDDLEIDREKNEGNYEPSNCRWVIHAINGRNTRKTKMNWTAVRIIRELFRIGYTRKELFEMFDITYQNLCCILNNTRWKEKCIYRGSK